MGYYDRPSCGGRWHDVWTLVSATCHLPRTVLNNHPMVSHWHSSGSLIASFFIFKYHVLKCTLALLNLLDTHILNSLIVIYLQNFNAYFTFQLAVMYYNSVQTNYYIVILRWPVGSRMLHQNTTVIRRVTTVRTERGVRLTVCQGDVS